MSDLTAVLAAADQQLTLVGRTLDETVERARNLLDRYDETSAWAILGTAICSELGLIGRYERFAVEMLAAAAIRLAGEPS